MLLGLDAGSRKNKVYLVNTYEEIIKKHRYGTRSPCKELKNGEHWKQCLIELPEFGNSFCKAGTGALLFPSIHSVVNC